MIAPNALKRIDIKEGQIWRERDPRFERYVKVTMLLRPRGLRVRTCDLHGDFKRGARQTEINQDRFSKAFTLIIDV